MIEQRSFGKKPSLASQIKRGEVFFDALHNEGTRIEILDRSTHIGKIARIAAQIAGEKSQHEGDGEAAQLVFAAYLSIGRVTCRAVNQLGIEQAENALTSPTTHSTLLDASKTLKSIRFDDVAKEFQTRGSWYDLDEDGLRWRTGISLPVGYEGVGCPYAFGNQNKADYFTAATDEAVRTYIDAHKENMPRTAFHRLVRPLVRK